MKRHRMVLCRFMCNLYPFALVFVYISVSKTEEAFIDAFLIEIVTNKTNSSWDYEKRIEEFNINELLYLFHVQLFFFGQIIKKQCCDGTVHVKDEICTFF